MLLLMVVGSVVGVVVVGVGGVVGVVGSLLAQQPLHHI